jgi:hypothetical protein
MMPAIFLCRLAFLNTLASDISSPVIIIHLVIMKVNIWKSSDHRKPNLVF